MNHAAIFGIKARRGITDGVIPAFFSAVAKKQLGCPQERRKSMHKHYALNDNWVFAEQCTDAFLNGEGKGTSVRLPHSCRELPYDYFDENEYEMLCAYRRMVFAPETWRGKSVRLTFGAAGHKAEVFLNGKKLAEHCCGYTAFTVELGDALRFGADNLLSVRLDTRESCNQPPFGFVIDYLTYGGLYREACLDVTEREYIADVFARPVIRESIKAGVAGTVQSTVTCACVFGTEYCIRQALIRPESNEVLAQTVIDINGASTELALPEVEVKLWDIHSPALYLLCTELLCRGKVIDRAETRIGFRKAEFRSDGFYLNGKRLLLRGLNRHQSFPYVGYAMPASLQRFDADILKKELGLNAVRTSHYPQSGHFIDRCDELGLLVFTEIPGWQHIGGETWKATAVDNVREMVTQYRNHPSIILWGVRINESSDDDAFYTKTNDAAHALDPTRPTGGVRCIKKSSLLEDVYTYNDFLHDGKNAGCEKKRDVTPDLGKAYLISEYNGHMFPAKMFDSEYHLLEHALRHAKVLDAVAAEKDIAGCFGWCMFDYNTHRDFGSGDRICYHGVMDMFRNPKPAAMVYAAQQEESPVLFVSSGMDIGEHPAGQMGRIYIITNADSVRVYKNDRFLKEYTQADTEFRHLRHGPILMDDYLGTRIEEEEGFSPKQSRLVSEILNYSAVNGFSRLNLRIKLKALKAMLLYKMNYDDAYRLYGKYIGGWGDTTSSYRFEAIKNGTIIQTIIRSPVRHPVLYADADHVSLLESETYDVAAVRVRLCDENGGLLRFYNGSVVLQTEGPIEIVGPKVLQLRGGCGGTYIRTTGCEGDAVLRLQNDQSNIIEICFTVKIAQQEDKI